MLLVNLIRLLFLLQQLFSKNKIMEPIICLIFICMQERDVAYEPEAPMVSALGGLVYFMSICVKIHVKICFGA